MKKKSLKVKSGYIYNTTYPGEENYYLPNCKMFKKMIERKEKIFLNDVFPNLLPIVGYFHLNNKINSVDGIPVITDKKFIGLFQENHFL